MASSLSLFFLNGCNLKGSYPIQEKVQKPPLVLSTSTIYATCFGQTTLFSDFLLQKQKLGSIVNTFVQVLMMIVLAPCAA